jgi:hypothetical protein
VEYVLTQPQKQLVKRLLSVGYWKSEEEVVGYGLNLIAREIGGQETLDTYPVELLADAYTKLSKSDHEEEAVLSRASTGPAAGELE